MAELNSRQFPVVRSRSGNGDVNFTAVDPEGNKGRAAYDANLADVNARLEDARTRWADGSGTDESARADLSAAYDERDSVGRMPDRHAVGTVTYYPQKLAPNNTYEWDMAAMSDKPLTLFREERAPSIDVWGADPAYAGQGVGKQVLNRAVEEHWQHHPSQRGTMPPISRTLSADSSAVLTSLAGDDAPITSEWTSSRKRMDEYARGVVAEQGGLAARDYVAAAQGGEVAPGTVLPPAEPADLFGRKARRTVMGAPESTLEEKVADLHRGPVQGPPDPRTPLRRAMDSESGQLPLFVTGDEMVAAARPHAGDKVSPDETDQELWDRKKAEADASGITESIDKKGVVRPVRVTGGGTVKNGHHRIAGAGEHWFAPDWDANEGSMPGPEGDGPRRFDPRLVGLPKFHGR